jgi:hypothetical protein
MRVLAVAALIAGARVRIAIRPTGVTAIALLPYASSRRRIEGGATTCVRRP